MFIVFSNLFYALTIHSCQGLGSLDLSSLCKRHFMSVGICNVLVDALMLLNWSGYTLKIANRPKDRGSKYFFFSTGATFYKKKPRQ